MNHAIIFNGTTDKINGCRHSGAHRIATHLRDQSWNVEVVDYTWFWSLEQMQELIKSRATKDTKFIGFSSIFSTAWDTKYDQLCKWIKDTYKDIFTVSGSQGYLGYDSEFIDYYIVGYGEHALDALLQWKVSNGPRPKFKLTTDKKYVIDAINTHSSHPMRNPIIRYEDRDFIDPEEFLGVELSRGCKFSCDFCNFPVLGVKGDYSRTAESFELQLRDAYDRFGVKNYYISDETINDRTEKLTKYADVVEQLPWDPWFAGFVRPDLMIAQAGNREELGRMRVFGQYYGVESFNHETVKSIGKGMHPDRIKAGLIEAKNYYQRVSNNCFRADLGLNIGLPYETLNTLEDGFKWIQENWQGHNITPWVLEIYNDDLSRPSKMSLDYGKYGYEESNEPMLYPNAIWDVSLSRSVLNWKNKWMTLNDARTFREKIQPRAEEVIPALVLSYQWRNEDTTPMTLDQRFNISFNDTRHSDRLKSTWKSFFNRYVEKKLNWTAQ